MGGARSKHENMKYAKKIIIGKSEGKAPHERPRYSWENNIKMDLREIGGRVWTDRAKDRNRWRAFVNTVINFPVP
jgi:hypothetical protein